MPRFGFGFGLGQRNSEGGAPSEWDGGSFRFYSGATVTDAGDLLASGTIPSPAFNEAVAGVRTKRGTWAAPVSINGRARSLYLRSADGLTKAFRTVTESGGGGDVIIDDDGLVIGETVVLDTLAWADTIGSVSGTVVDGAAAPVAGCIVQLIDDTDVVVDTDTTDGSGAYSFANVDQGEYTIKFHPSLAYSLGPSEPDSRSVSVHGAETVNGVLQRAIHSDDFQSYAVVADVTYGSVGSHSPTIGKFGYAPGVVDSVNVAGLVIGDYAFDTTGGPAGGKALRYNWPARPAGSTSYFIGMQFRINPLPSLGSSLYVRMTSKESSGFRQGGGGVTGSGCEYKFLFVDLNPTGQPSGAATLELENLTTNPSANIGFRLKLVDGASYGAPWNGSPSSEVAHGGSGDPVLTGWDGSYHTWVIAITGLGTAAQTCVVYKDGVAFCTLANAPFYPNVAIVAGALTIELGANINNGPDLAQSRWFSEIGVYKTRCSLLPQAS